MDGLLHLVQRGRAAIDLSPNKFERGFSDSGTVTGDGAKRALHPFPAFERSGRSPAARENFSETTIPSYTQFMYNWLDTTFHIRITMLIGSMT